VLGPRLSRVWGPPFQENSCFEPQILMKYLEYSWNIWIQRRKLILVGYFFKIRKPASHPQKTRIKTRIPLFSNVQRSTSHEKHCPAVLWMRQTELLFHLLRQTSFPLSVQGVKHKTNKFLFHLILAFGCVKSNHDFSSEPSSRFKHYGCAHTL